MLGSPNNNNQKKQYSPVLYSKYGYSNPDSKIDPSRLSVSMWGGLLKLAIQPMSKDSTPDNPSYDIKNSGDIFLSHTKAQLLANEIKLFLSDPKEYNNRGVSTNKGLIVLDNGIELTGAYNPLLIIYAISEDGNINSQFIYDFKTKYHYMIRNFNEKKPDMFVKEFDPNIEIVQLVNLLEDYYRAMSGAYAYANIEYGKFDYSRINTKIGLIAEKLGVEFKDPNNQRRQTRSVFDTSSGISGDKSNNNYNGGLTYEDMSEDVDF